MLRTLEATLDPAGKVHFAEEVRLTKSQRVLVTLLDDEFATVQPDDQDGNVKHVLALLASPEFRRRPYGSPEAMEATIQENRNAWEE
jgi:hypothetical protein